MGARGFLFRIMISGILFLALSALAFAYIDPATGGAIVGSIWPFIIGILGAIGAFLLKYFLKPIKNNVSQLWKKIKGNG